MTMSDEVTLPDGTTWVWTGGTWVLVAQRRHPGRLSADEMNERVGELRRDFARFLGEAPAPRCGVG